MKIAERAYDIDRNPSKDLYHGYETWKGWRKPFTYTADEADYFAGELRDAKIAHADVLAIGFGSGSFLAWARDRGARVVGTEINPVLLSAAAKFDIKLLPATLEVVAHDYASRFDTVVAFDVFEHLTFDEIITDLKATETMLKSEGHLILRFPNAQSPFGLAPQHGDPTHKSALSRNSFEQLTYGMNLKIVRYAPSFRARGGPMTERLVRAIRYAVRDLIGATLNAVYAQSIPWDSVVTLVMQKSSPPET